MTKTRREIECLSRLQVLNGNMEDIIEFLLSENLMSKEDAKAYKHAAELPKMMQKLLSSLAAANKFQLMEYEWSILPVERIKLLLITDRQSKEFTYNF